MYLFAVFYIIFLTTKTTRDISNVCMLFIQNGQNKVHAWLITNNLYQYALQQ